jgi:hypothetical protein
VHVAAIFDEQKSRLRVAVNGVVEDDQPPGCCTATTNLAITIGRRTLLAEGYFRGRLDEVRISSSVRDLDPVAVDRTSYWSQLKELMRDPQ